MSLNLSTSNLNRNCQPSPIVFQKERQATAMLNFRHRDVAKRNKEKCEDTSPYLQKGSKSPIIHYGECEETLGIRLELPLERFNFLKTPQGLLQFNKPGIRLALERRVALFFQQAILCYQMDAFEFVAGKAVDQIGVSKTLCVKSEDDQRIFLKREAAHSSTLPTLIAIPKDGSLPEGFVYLKGGFSHYQHNSTIGMSVAVNGADEVIDGKRPTEGLRGASIRIINRVASGLDPVKATRVFISTFKEILDSLIEERREKEDQKDVYEVIKYYKKRIEKIERALATDDLFDQLLGVIIDNEDPRAKKIHRIVYKKRYDIIRLQEIIESRIAKRIEDVKEQMGRSKSRLEFLLLKQFMGKEEKIILEKLFAKTAAIFEENYPQAQDSKFKSFVTSIDHKKDELAPLLRSLFDNLRIDFRELSCAEFTYRSTLFRQLRIDVCNWTQKEFIEQFKEINNSEISASWVSRMEQLGRLPYKQEYKTPTGQRRSYITLDVAQKCAKTFDIDPGLFLPSLFTSS